FSLATVSLPACSSAIWSRMGAIILHGPHHSAQKSTRMGSEEPETISSKVASVRVVGMVRPCWDVPVRPDRTVLPTIDRGPAFPPPCLRQPSPAHTNRCSPGSGSASGVLCLEPALGVDRRLAARARCGDGLPVGVVLHVAAGE